jgi:hypothetical protein
MKSVFTLLVKGDEFLLLGGANGLIYRTPAKFYAHFRDRLRLPIAVAAQNDKPVIKFGEAGFNIISNDAIPQDYICMFSCILDEISRIEICCSFEELSNTWLLKEYVNEQGKPLNVYHRLLTEDEVKNYGFKWGKCEVIEIDGEEIAA